MLRPETGRMMLDTATGQTEGKEPDVADDVVDLHTRTVDALAGFEKMVEKAEPEFREVVERFRELHARHAVALKVILADLGIKADDDGSFMGTVNEAVVSLRAFFDEIDEDSMDNIRSGEKHVLRAFDAAIAGGLPQPHEESIVDMRAELRGLLDATKDID